MKLSQLSHRLSTLLLLSSLSLGLSACGMKNFWGEKPKGPPVITAFSQGSSCPDPMLILKGTEEQSEAALNCVTTQLNDLWTQIEGEKKDTLSDFEIRALVERNVIALDGDHESQLRQLFEMKRLLGMNGSLDRDKLESWIEFLRARRPQLRQSFRKFFVEGGPVRYSDLRTAANVIASFLYRLDWRMTSDELVSALETFVKIPDREIREALIPTADLAINILNMTCPQFERKDFWNTRELANCMVSITDHFKGGAAWFEFVLNPVHDFSNLQEFEIKAALERLGGTDDEDPRKRKAGLITQWFNDQRLTTLQLEKLIRVAERMGAAPPEKTLASLSVIRNFKGRDGKPGKSNEKFLYPDEAIPYIFDQIIRPAQVEILSNIGHFVSATRMGKCANTGATYWTECALTEFPWRKPLTSIDLVLRVKNIKHGQKAAPLNGRRLSKVLFFNALANKVIQAFDRKGVCREILPLGTKHGAIDALNESPSTPGEDNCNIPDGIITTKIRFEGDNEYDEFLELLTASTELASTVGRFYENIERKLQGLPLVRESQTPIDGNWDMAGFIRLIAMTSDVLVMRPASERNLLEKVLSNLTNVFPSYFVFLDHLAVTAIINLIDELPEYREAYLRLSEMDLKPGTEATNSNSIVVTEEVGTRRHLVVRDSVMKNLDKIVGAAFPRTHESCMDYLRACDWQGRNCSPSELSFERSCGIAMDEILSGPKPGTPYINASDLDILTIIGVAMESVIDSCNAEDRPDDVDSLELNLLDGDDELDCGFIKAKDVVSRLMDSKILEVKGTDEDVIKFLLNFASSTFITRPMGKIAMVRGKMSVTELVLNQLTFWAYRKGATVGSLYGLISDLADPARADGLERKVHAAAKGAKKSPSPTPPIAPPALPTQPARPAPSSSPGMEYRS